MKGTDYLDLIRQARVYDVAEVTPLEYATNLSRRLGNRVLMKREDLQPVFSFKLRGAYNKIANLDADELGNGVICSSAGNHAQGVALAASSLDTRARIVMPEYAPLTKREATQNYGADVILHGASYDHVELAYAAARTERGRQSGARRPGWPSSV